MEGEYRRGAGDRIPHVNVGERHDIGMGDPGIESHLELYHTVEVPADDILIAGSGGAYIEIVSPLNRY